MNLPSALLSAEEFLSASGGMPRAAIFEVIYSASLARRTYLKVVLARAENGTLAATCETNRAVAFLESKEWWPLPIDTGASSAIKRLIDERRDAFALREGISLREVSIDISPLKVFRDLNLIRRNRSLRMIVKI